MTFWFLPCSAQNQSTVPTPLARNNRIKKGLTPRRANRLKWMKVRAQEKGGSGVRRLCERQNSTTTLPPCSTTHRAQQSERSWKRNKFASSPSLPPSLPRGSVPIPIPEPALRRHALSSTLTCLLCWLAGCLLAGWLGGQMLSRSRPIRRQGDAGGAAVLDPRARAGTLPWEGRVSLDTLPLAPLLTHCKMCRVTLY